jgi:hypothetical protein
MSPSPKNTGVPKFGNEVASIIHSVDRIDSISRKLDIVLASQADIIRRLDALESKGGKAKR